MIYLDMFYLPYLIESYLKIHMILFNQNKMDFLCNDCGHTDFIRCCVCKTVNISILPDAKEYIKYIETHFNKNQCSSDTHVFKDDILSPIIKLTYDFCRETSCSCMKEDIRRLVNIALNKFDYTNTFVENTMNQMKNEYSSLIQ